MTQRVKKARDACEAAVALLKTRLLTAPAPLSAKAQLTTVAPPFDREVLFAIEKELEAMLKCLDPRRFNPTFGWYLADQYTPGDALGEALMAALDAYERIRPKDQA